MTATVTVRANHWPVSVAIDAPIPADVAEHPGLAQRLEPCTSQDFTISGGQTLTAFEIRDDGSGDRPLDASAMTGEGG